MNVKASSSSMTVSPRSVCLFCLHRRASISVPSRSLPPPGRLIATSSRSNNVASQDSNAPLKVRRIIGSERGFNAANGSGKPQPFPRISKFKAAPHSQSDSSVPSGEQPRRERLPSSRSDLNRRDIDLNKSFRSISPNLKPDHSSFANEEEPIRDARAPAFRHSREREHRTSSAANGLDFDNKSSRHRPGLERDRRSKDPRDGKANRRSVKFTDEDDDLDNEALAERERRRARKEEKKRIRMEKEEAARAAQAKQIELPTFINLSNLATLLKVRQADFLNKLAQLGFTELNNDSFISYEDASLIAMEYGFQARIDRSELDDLKPRPHLTDKSLLPQRPPVVTIMGHVDHGKTTLLDYLRKSSVAAQEHGGITQHIGAFSVPMVSGKTITFLDTPGHAAFLSMRQRGANVTDIVILVVAADDSVKPQTIEAIKHAKAAKVPIIVAINKVDKEDSDVEKVKQDLVRHDITVEDFGGDVQAYPVSGKTGQGLDDLVEAIDTQAEVLDMRAEKDGEVEGWVLETSTTRAGRMATVLVRRGTLQPGDTIVAGTTWARVRTLKNEAGSLVSQAPPGTPVEVDGWREQPEAGNEVLRAPSEQKAASVVHYRKSKLQEDQAAKDMEHITEYRRIESERRAREKQEQAEKKASAANLDQEQRQNSKAQDDKDQDGVVRAISKQQAPKHQSLYFIIKADVSGSAEAIEESITALPVSNQPVSLNILRTGVGQISEFDVEQAATVDSGQSFVVSFNQPVPAQIAIDLERQGVTLLDETIIYKVLDSVRSAIEAKLPPIISKRVVGEAEAAQVFDINTSGRKYLKVAGCRVRNGTVEKGKRVRVFRGGNPSVNSDENLVYEGTISTLKSHKTDVQEMRKGSECGMSFEKWQDFQAGDIIQCYEEKSELRRLY